MTHNFYAGPSILSKYTVCNTAEAIQHYDETGMSIMEISHRSKEFEAVIEEARLSIRKLLEVPETHEIIFLGGGASMQFCMVPYNLLKTKASYLDTGTWASKAIKEAKFFGEVDVVASSKDRNYSYIPRDFKVAPDTDYLHITTNNTIFGTQIHNIPSVKVPLVADMSSDIFSRPIDVSKFDLIYAGAQKNFAPAGLTLVIVRKDALGKAGRPIPTMLNYKTHVDNGSMYNTPPVVQIYAALMTFRWFDLLGGIPFHRRFSKEKAHLLYNEIDRNRLFKGTADVADRSLMNICFVMNEEYADLEEEFATYAEAAGMIGLRGHRSVGGFRASVYNAMPIESVEALVKTMRSFDRSK
jgi:phosphoserine aminotransferase